jgi:hypothetical protein
MTGSANRVMDAKKFRIAGPLHSALTAAAARP